MHTRRIFITAVVLAVIAAGPLLAQVRGAAPPAFHLIVNPQNGITSVDRKFVADVFLKKVTRWGQLDAIRPADLRPDSAIRQAFTDEVLRRSVAAVRNYWQQQVFSGRDVPPPELDSDDEVVAFVLRYPGAIGYVSAGASLKGAKILTIK